MPSKPAGAGKSAKNKTKGVRGPPRYATNPTGTIKTRNQDTRDALSAVMSQLHEKSGQKFLPETAPEDGAQLHQRLVPNHYLHLRHLLEKGVTKVTIRVVSIKKYLVV